MGFDDSNEMTWGVKWCRGEHCFCLLGIDECVGVGLIAGEVNIQRVMESTLVNVDRFAGARPIGFDFQFLVRCGRIFLDCLAEYQI